VSLNVIQKLIGAQLVTGEAVAGSTVSMRINQTLADDRVAATVLDQLQERGVERVQCDIAAFYVDHHIVPHDWGLAQQHRRVRAEASRFGALFSRAGNGTGHCVHLERVAMPGRTLLGATERTTSLGAVGMLALPAEPATLAAAMAGEPYQFEVPRTARVQLHGRPRPFISPLDVGLELLRRHGVGGLQGYALEFDGAGARPLGVYERAAIASVSTTLGAVTAVFPSDEKVRIFLQRQRRSKAWRRLEADQGASYDLVEDIDLAALEPLVASHGAEGLVVRPVRELQGEPVGAVHVGARGGASLRDLLVLAGIMRGKKVSADCVLTVSPGSRQSLEVLARYDEGGGLADLISAGVRMLECGCLPAESLLGAQPAEQGGRACTELTDGAGGNFPLFVMSPETAAATAIQGEIGDPRRLRRPPRVKLPQQLPIDDSMIMKVRTNDAGGTARTWASRPSYA
jgi:aconitate hydratase